MSAVTHSEISSMFINWNYAPGMKVLSGIAEEDEPCKEVYAQSDDATERGKLQEILGQIDSTFVPSKSSGPVAPKGSSSR